MQVRPLALECHLARERLASQREEDGVLHVAQVRGVVVNVVLEKVDLVRREGDAQLGDDAVLRAVDDLGGGAKEDEHVDRAALLRDEEPVASLDEARLCELAAVLPSSLVKHLSRPLDAVEVGRELCGGGP